MTDENLEHHLRNLLAPELPESWRAEIIATACREARVSAKARAVWPDILLYLRALLARNPITGGALAMLWMLIFVFKAGTPVDPYHPAYNMAKFDPSRPIYFVTIPDEIRFALMDEDQPPRRSLRQIP